MRYLVIAIVILLTACTGNSNKEKQESKVDELAQAIIDLKDSALQGDLITRLGDDLMSNQIRSMNEKEKAYSHSGLILIKNNEKLVAEIGPGPIGTDIIKYTPIDSFINPKYNVYCALYRYDLSGKERISLADTIKGFEDRHVRFDSIYKVETNDKLYCSEMIAKALQGVTNNRIKIKTTKAPQRMIKLLTAFFKPLGISQKEILARDMISIDNLYLRADCRLITKIKLKTFPGE